LTQNGLVAKNPRNKNQRVITFPSISTNNFVILTDCKDLPFSLLASISNTSKMAQIGTSKFRVCSNNTPKTSPQESSYKGTKESSVNKFPLRISYINLPYSENSA
jgi:hypothetical protein